MKIIEKTTMPDGVKIQLEDWKENGKPVIIGTYPVAVNDSSKNFIRKGSTFRLTMNFKDTSTALENFVKLKNGEISLDMLSGHFHHGKRDEY